MTTMQREDGLLEIQKTYTSYVGERLVIVHGVPYLVDPETFEEFLSPDTAEKLYEMIENPTLRSSVASGDLYRWENSEIPKPALAIRFTGKGFEYGQTPISQFARAVDKVRNSSSGLIHELAKLEERPIKSLDPFISEPRVAHIGSGSLVVALEPPDEGLFPDLTDQKFVKQAIELLVEVANWAINEEQLENSDPPESLKDKRVRAAALRSLEKLLPGLQDQNSQVHFSGQFVEDKIGHKLNLSRDNKQRVRNLFAETVAEIAEGETVKLVGVIQNMDVNGSFKLGELDWEAKQLKGTFEATDLDTFMQLNALFVRRQPVTVQGVLNRKPDGKAKELKLLFVELYTDSE